MTNYFSSVEIFHIPQTAFSSNQPDSCTSGTLLKTDFYAEDGRHIYLKLPHHEKDNSWGMESIQEIVCSNLGKALGLDILEYYPCLVDLMNNESAHFGCYSLDYRHGAEAYSAKTICTALAGKYSTSLQTLQELGFAEYADKIMVFDFLIGNADRHANNIEFLMQDDTLLPATIFDNGKSLLETFAPYPKMWDKDQLTNNFLTDGHTERTFQCVSAPVCLSSLSSIHWEEIFSEVNDFISPEEKRMIIDFVSHQYTTLQERGLIIND